MKIKIVHDPFENEYIAFLDKCAAISGYGSTEKEAILNFLHQASIEDGFNHQIVNQLIEKIENES